MLPDTQQADYHVVASVMYRANGAVATPCLAQYSDLLAQYYSSLNHVLTQRCSAVNVNMSVSFVDTKPRLIDENVVQVMFKVWPFAVNWQGSPDTCPLLHSLSVWAPLPCVL
jgi:hypothetical protein